MRVMILKRMVVRISLVLALREESKISEDLSAPNQNAEPKSQEFSPKSLSRPAQIALSNRTICDFNLCSNRR